VGAPAPGVRSTRPGDRPILTPAFLWAAASNFLFFTNLAAFFLLPLYLKQLGTTETQLGLVMGLYSGTAIFCQPLVGLWVDRTGRRPFMLAGATLAAAVCVVFAVAPARLPLVALLRVLQGMAYAMFFIASFTLVVDLVPADRRGRALGIFGISGLTSMAIGPAVGEAVVRAFGFRVFFLALAVVAGAALAVSARIEEVGPRQPVDRAGLPGLLAGLLAAPRLPMALGSSFGLGTGVVFTFLPTYAESLGVARIGVFAIAYAVGALTVRAVAGGLIDAVGRRAVLVPALALQAAAAGILATLGPLVTRAGLPALPFLALTGLVAGIAHGFLYPALSALVVDLTPPERRGRVIGVFSAFILAGQAAGAIGGGTLAHAVGYPATFAVLAVCLTGACGLAFKLKNAPASAS
jgi:MFS family permease